MPACAHPCPSVLTQGCCTELPTVACNFPIKTSAPEEWRVASLTLNFSKDSGELDLQTLCLCCANRDANWVISEGHLD